MSKIIKFSVPVLTFCIFVSFCTESGVKFNNGVAATASLSGSAIFFNKTNPIQRHKKAPQNEMRGFFCLSVIWLDRRCGFRANQR